MTLKRIYYWYSLLDDAAGAIVLAVFLIVFFAIVDIAKRITPR